MLVAKEHSEGLYQHYINLQEKNPIYWIHMDP